MTKCSYCAGVIPEGMEVDVPNRCGIKDIYCQACFSEIECAQCGLSLDPDDAPPINRNGRFFHDEKCYKYFQKEISA